MKEQLMGQFGLNVDLPIFAGFFCRRISSNHCRGEIKKRDSGSHIKAERDGLQLSPTMTSRVFQVMKLPMC